MCGFGNVWVCVCVGSVMCGCFGNMCTCIYCVVLFRLCIFILLMFLFNSVSYVFLFLCLCIIVIYVLYILFSSCRLALFGYRD